MKPAPSIIGFTTCRVSATACCSRSPSARSPAWSRRTAGSASRSLSGAGIDHRRPVRLDPASRPSRAGLAGDQPVAQLLAVARGAGGADHLCPRHPPRHRLDRLRKRFRRLRPHGAGVRGRRRGDRLVHRHDLRLAAADQSLAPAADRTRLSRFRPDDRPSGPSPSADPVRRAAHADRHRHAARDRRRRRAQGHLLADAVERALMRPRYGQRHRPRPLGAGAHARSAAYADQLSPR